MATVLFADLVGFTGMSESADPENVKNLVDRCFARLAADIVAFGGRVDKVMGDAIVALFGAPVAHEDDPERAVRAALQMQATLAEMASERGIDVKMRIGVNTGEVLVGRLQAGDDYPAMGDVVNTASRLQTAAAPGEVLVGGATRDATRSIIRYEAVDDVLARNREAPVEAWRAIEALVRPGRRPRSRRTPMVGRVAELAVLEGLLDVTIAHRRGHLVLLSGDAGLGKSRLAEEVAARAGAHNAFVLEGHCVPYGEANVWWPIAEALHQALGIEHGDQHEEAAEKTRVLVGGALERLIDHDEVERTIAALLHVMGHEGALADVEPARVRDEVVLALHASLAAVARTRPVVVVLSDVHWADDRLLDLVDRLAERMAHDPLLVVLTTRPDIDERWSPRLGRHNLLHLNLDPLPAAATEDLLSELAGEGLSESMRTALLDRSGGNPFFLEELVALIGETGPTDVPADLPATLRGLVSARIDYLPGTERQVLEDAAVIGRTGPLETLAGLAANRGFTDGEGAVRALVDRDLLQVLGGEYEFKTDLVREVAYSTLSKAERARRHAAVAQLLDKRARGVHRSDEYLEPLAHHYGTAAQLAAEVGEVDGMPSDLLMTALHALERAANRAESRDEPLSVIRLVDLGLELLPHLPADKAARERWRALLARGRAHTAVHALAEAEADARTVIDEATAAGDEAAVACGEVVAGEAISKAGRSDDAEEVLVRAAERAERVGDDATLALARRHLGFNRLMRGQLPEAEDSIRLALDLFRGLEDRRGEAWALQNLAWISFLRGEPDIAAERLERSAATFREVGDRRGEGWALGLLAWVRYQQGRLDDAEELALRVRPQAIDRGERWAAGILGVLLGQIQLWRGRVEEAVERSQEAVTTFQEIDDRFGETQALGALVRALAAAGRTTEALGAVARAREIAQGDPNLDGMADSLECNVAVYLGEPERIAHLLTGGETVSRTQLLFAERAVTVGIAALQLGNVTQASEILERSAADVDNDGLRAYMAGPLALVRSASGDTDGAIRAASDLLDHDLGTHLDRLYAAVGLALTAARSGDGDTADAALAQAYAIVDRTEDRVAQAIARVAAVTVAEALGRPTATLEAEAAERFTRAGTEGPGWRRAFRLAAGVSEDDSVQVPA